MFVECNEGPRPTSQPKSAVKRRASSPQDSADTVKYQRADTTPATSAAAEAFTIGVGDTESEKSDNDNIADDDYPLAADSPQEEVFESVHAQNLADSILAANQVFRDASEAIIVS